MQSDMIKPTFVPTFGVVVNSIMTVSIGTDTAECVDAILGDTSTPVGKHFLCTSWSIGAQIHYVISWFWLWHSFYYETCVGE